MEPSVPKVQIIEIDEESVGQRIDNYLHRELKGVPRSHIYKLLRRGEVRLNGGRIKASTRLQAGDRLRLPPVRTSQGVEHRDTPEWIAQKIVNSIIYKDNRMLIINKPAGVAVHGGSGISGGVIEVLRRLYPKEKALQLVHRLDRETSGCLMVARRRSSLRLLQTALRERQMLHKYYRVIVHGQWPVDLTSVKVALVKNTLQSGERYSRVSGEGKASRTRYQLLATDGNFSLLQAEPVTGRTHQIRVHCAHSGHPIVGDPKYGDSLLDKPVRQMGHKRMMLHAYRLEISSLADGDAPLDTPFDTPFDAPLIVEADAGEAFSIFAKYIKNRQL